MRRIAFALFVTVAVSSTLLVLQSAGAAPGDLDPTFGSGGTVDTPIGASAGVSDLLIQPDGKLVAGGSSAVPRSTFTLARYGSNGALDASFGAEGVAWGPEGVSRAIGLQPDGKILLAGNQFILDFSVARFQPSGSVDTDFGSGGTVIGLEGAAESLTIQPDGKIVAAGTGPVTYLPYAFERRDRRAATARRTPLGELEAAGAAAAGEARLGGCLGTKLQSLRHGRSPPARSLHRARARLVLHGGCQQCDPRLDNAAGGLGKQIGVNKAVEGSVEDSLGVPDLVLGAVVLDQLVRVEHVAADRVPAEAHAHVATLLGEFGVPLLFGLLGQA